MSGHSDLLGKILIREQLKGAYVRAVIFNAGARRRLEGLPRSIQVAFVSGLRTVAAGEMPLNAKVLRGFGGADVVELRERDRAGTYRAVYTVRFEEAVYVLHVFQKKSKTGTKTDRQDIALIDQRLRWAEEQHRERSGK
jgi:phage-related protein